MPEQKNLFEHDAPRPRPSPVPASAPVSWLARVEAGVRFVVRLYLGLLIMALPWLDFWMQNNLFTYHPLLTTLAENGFVRGMVSGLGALNVVLAVRELFRPRR